MSVKRGWLFTSVFVVVLIAGWMVWMAINANFIALYQSVTRNVSWAVPAFFVVLSIVVGLLYLAIVVRLDTGQCP